MDRTPSPPEFTGDGADTNFQTPRRPRATAAHEVDEFQTPRRAPSIGPPSSTISEDPRTPRSTLDFNEGSSPLSEPPPSPVRESTPVSVKASTKGVDHKKGGYTAAAANEMEHSATEVTVPFFLKTYLPGKNFPGRGLSKICRKLTSGIEKAKKESDMYEPLCVAWNAVLAKSPYTVKETADRNEDAYADHKPDLTLYDETFGKESWEVTPTSRLPASKLKHKAIAGFAWNICLVEVKHKESQDPFGKEHEQVTFPQGSAQTREQIIRYVVEMFLRQHREFAFLIVIFGHKARLTRWDHVGVVITEPFDYVQKPSRLLNFVYRLSNAGRAGQGFDTSVRLADPHQIDDLKKYRDSTSNVYEKGFINEMLEDVDLYPVQQLRMHCDVLPNKPSDSWGEQVEGKDLTLLIGKYRVRSYSPTGRATKGYFAYAVGMNRLLFMKVSWRPDLGQDATEVQHYKELYAAKVPYIAKLVCWGDTKHDASMVHDRDLTLHTRTQELLKIDRVQKRIQTRLVFETLGIPLSEYAKSASLISVLYCALIAHYRAWKDAHILHRDISIGNILIDIHSPDMLLPIGILNDWDLSKRKVDLDTRRSHARSGTWAFMSGPLLRFPIKPPKLYDDLEGFVHVTDFCTLRFHRTTYTDEDKWNPEPKSTDFNKKLTNFVGRFFFDDEKSGDYWYGGDEKFDVYLHRTEGSFPWSLMHTSVLSQLVQELHGLCSTHYRSLDQKDLQKYGGKERSLADSVTVAAFSPEDSNSEIPTSEDPFLLDEHDPFLNNDLPRIFNAASRSTAAFASAPPVPRPEDPFKDHAAILHAFHTAVREIKQQRLSDPPWGPDDKTVDQFLHLPSIGYLHDKSLSTTSGTKRKADGDGSSQDLANKRSRGGNSRSANSSREGADG